MTSRERYDKAELKGCSTGMLIAVIGSAIIWFFIIYIIISLVSCNLTYQTRSGLYNWEGKRIDSLTIKK